MNKLAIRSLALVAIGCAATGIWYLTRPEPVTVTIRAVERGGVEETVPIWGLPGFPGGGLSEWWGGKSRAQTLDTTNRLWIVRQTRALGHRRSGQVSQ